MSSSLINYPKFLYKRFFKYINKKPKKVKYQPQREILEDASTFGLLCMYNGKNYYGSQINNGSRTVEGEIIKSLFQLNLISEQASKFPQLCYFSRTSRTDRLVSATGQLFSVHLKKPDNITDLFTQLKNYLPNDIILLDVLRLTQGFRSKHCDSRIYEYVIPTYAFDINELNIYEQREYRISNDTLVKLNHILKLFQGRSNYHNYSSGKDALSPTAYRFIINVESSSPFLINDMEFVTIHIHGHSFMIHQIRKMIATTVSFMKAQINYTIFRKSFSFQKVLLPKAPATGLLLERVLYDNYNKKFAFYDANSKPIIFQNYNVSLNTIFGLC